MKRISKLPQAFAFVVTKADSDRELWNRRDANPEQILKEITFDKVISTIESHCAHWQVFVSSSVGAILDSTLAYKSANMDNTNTGDGYASKIKDLKYFEPEGVLEPIQWMLEEIQKKRIFG